MEAIKRTRVAVIGDYGQDSQPEADVATLVDSLQPDFVVTTGDNNCGTNSTFEEIDARIGKYYQQFIYPYTGTYGAGDPKKNRFFPTLGNHDRTPPGNLPLHLDYFGLNNNERYYDFARGDIHFFVVDSGYDSAGVNQEPDGNTEGSIQGQWLRIKLLLSTARWKVVVLHHPPYTSGSGHGPSPDLRWPFRLWGAHAVIAGHAHHYERLGVDGIPYFVNGAGGATLHSFNPIPEQQSRKRLKEHGAMLITADCNRICFEFIDTNSQVLDEFCIGTVPPVVTGPTTTPGTTTPPPDCPIDFTVDDLGILNLDGTIYGVPEPDVIVSPFPGFGNAYQFNGQDVGTDSQGIAIHPVLFGGLFPFTVEAKIAVGALPASRTVFMIASNVSDDIDYNWALYIDNSMPGSARVTFLAITAGGVPVFAAALNTVSEFTNYTVRAVFDGTSIYVYQDGQRGFVVPCGPIQNSDQSQDAFVGRSDAFMTGNLPGTFSGTIDEVRISDIARSTGPVYSVDPFPFTSDIRTIRLYHLDGCTPPTSPTTPTPTTTPTSTTSSTTTPTTTTTSTTTTSSTTTPTTTTPAPVCQFASSVVFNVGFTNPEDALGPNDGVVAGMFFSGGGDPPQVAALELGFSFVGVPDGAGLLRFWGRSSIGFDPPPAVFKIITKDDTAGETEVYSSVDTDFDFLTTPLEIPISSQDWASFTVLLRFESQDDSNTYEVDAVQVCNTGEQTSTTPTSTTSSTTTPTTTTVSTSTTSSTTTPTTTPTPTTTGTTTATTTPTVTTPTVTTGPSTTPGVTTPGVTTPVTTTPVTPTATTPTSTTPTTTGILGCVGATSFNQISGQNSGSSSGLGLHNGTVASVGGGLGTSEIIYEFSIDTFNPASAELNLYFDDSGGNGFSIFYFDGVQEVLIQLNLTPGANHLSTPLTVAVAVSDWSQFYVRWVLNRPSNAFIDAMEVCFPPVTASTPTSTTPGVTTPGATTPTTPTTTETTTTYPTTTLPPGLAQYCAIAFTDSLQPTVSPENGLGGRDTFTAYMFNPGGGDGLDIRYFYNVPSAAAPSASLEVFIAWRNFNAPGNQLDISYFNGVAEVPLLTVIGPSANQDHEFVPLVFAVTVSDWESFYVRYHLDSISADVFLDSACVIVESNLPTTFTTPTLGSTTTLTTTPLDPGIPDGRVSYLSFFTDDALIPTNPIMVIHTADDDYNIKLTGYNNQGTFSAPNYFEDGGREYRLDFYDFDTSAFLFSTPVQVLSGLGATVFQIVVNDILEVSRLTRRVKINKVRSPSSDNVTTGYNESANDAAHAASLIVDAQARSQAMLQADISEDLSVQTEVVAQGDGMPGTDTQDGFVANFDFINVEGTDQANVNLLIESTFGIRVTLYKKNLDTTYSVDSGRAVRLTLIDTRNIPGVSPEPITATGTTDGGGIITFTFSSTAVSPTHDLILLEPVGGGAPFSRYILSSDRMFDRISDTSLAASIADAQEGSAAPYPYTPVSFISPRESDGMIAAFFFNPDAPLFGDFLLERYAPPNGSGNVALRALVRIGSTINFRPQDPGFSYFFRLRNVLGSQVFDTTADLTDVGGFIDVTFNVSSLTESGPWELTVQGTAVRSTYFDPRNKQLQSAPHVVVIGVMTNSEDDTSPFDPVFTPVYFQQPPVAPPTTTSLTTPTVTTPTTLATTTPTGTTPSVTTPVVTTLTTTPVSTPTATTPVFPPPTPTSTAPTTPPVTTPTSSTPTVTTLATTTPFTPSVTTPVTPSPTTPGVTTPTSSTPSVTTPVSTTPVTPSVTTPSVTTPTSTAPPVTLPGFCHAADGYNILSGAVGNPENGFGVHDGNLATLAGGAPTEIVRYSFSTITPGSPNTASLSLYFNDPTINQLEPFSIRYFDGIQEQLVYLGASAINFLTTPLTVQINVIDWTNFYVQWMSSTSNPGINPQIDAMEVCFPPVTTTATPTATTPVSTTPVTPTVTTPTATTPAATTPFTPSVTTPFTPSEITPTTPGVTTQTVTPPAPACMPGLSVDCSDFSNCANAVGPPDSIYATSIDAGSSQRMDWLDFGLPSGGAAVARLYFKVTPSSPLAQYRIRVVHAGTNTVIDQAINGTTSDFTLVPLSVSITANGPGFSDSIRLLINELNGVNVVTIVDACCITLTGQTTPTTLATTTPATPSTVTLFPPTTPGATTLTTPTVTTPTTTPIAACPTGSLVEDSSGNNNHGVTSGASPPQPVPSPFGAAFNNAYEFNGSDDCCITTEISGAGSPTYSVELFMRADGNGTIVGAKGSTSEFFSLTVSGSGATRTIQYASLSSTINIGQTYHIEINYNSSVRKMFINGVQVPGTGGGVSFGNPTTFTIGARRLAALASLPTDEFVGVIDEVRISDSVRNTSGFTPPASPYSSDANTVALWHLDECGPPAPTTPPVGAAHPATFTVGDSGSINQGNALGLPDGNVATIPASNESGDGISVGYSISETLPTPTILNYYGTVSVSVQVFIQNDTTIVASFVIPAGNYLSIPFPFSFTNPNPSISYVIVPANLLSTQTVDALILSF